MANYRKQKFLTITKEQQDFIDLNFGKMNLGSLAKMLGMGYGKLWCNLELLGKVKKQKAKIIKMDGYFDVDQFAKYYNF